MGNISYRFAFEDDIFICSQLQRHWLFLPACFIYCCLTFNYTIFYLYTITYVLSFRFVFFFTEEQERVQKKTFTNWINSYLSKVSFLSCQCYSIYPTIYLSIYRISIDSPLKFAYPDVRHLFFLSFDHEVDILYIANILNVPNLMELFFSKCVRERERESYGVIFFDLMRDCQL